MTPLEVLIICASFAALGVGAAGVAIAIDILACHA